MGPHHRPSRPHRRRTAAGGAVLLLSLVLAGCGGDDGGGEDPSPRADGSGSAVPTSPTTTASSEPDEPTSSTTQALAPVPDEDVLAGALLTPADLPSGFAEAPDDGDDGDDGDDDGAFEDTCLADLGTFDDALGTEPDEEAEVELGAETPTGQASVSAKVKAYADAATVATTFADFTGSLQDCTSVESTVDGATYDLDITYDDTVDLTGAEDQIAFDVTGTVTSGEQGYPVEFGFVVSLSGQLLSVVGTTTIGEDATGIVADTHDLAEVQAARVAAIG